MNFLDPAYGREYLDRLEPIVDADEEARGWAFSREAAKYLANAMVYDDIIRVADLKSRSTRTRRVRDQVGLREGQALLTTEYFHPRMEEICGLLARRLGAAIEAHPGLIKKLDRVVDRGRRIRTDSVCGFGTQGRSAACGAGGAVCCAIMSGLRIWKNGWRSPCASARPTTRSASRC